MNFVVIFLRVNPVRQVAGYRHNSDVRSWELGLGTWLIIESVNNHLTDSSHAGAKEGQQNCEDELN